MHGLSTLEYLNMTAEERAKEDNRVVRLSACWAFEDAWGHEHVIYHYIPRAHRTDINAMKKLTE